VYELIGDASGSAPTASCWASSGELGQSAVGPIRADLAGGPPLRILSLAATLNLTKAGLGEAKGAL